MLADKTNTYQNKEVEGSLSKKLQTPMDLHYQPQIFEKTSSFINLHDDDLNHDQESVISKDPEIQKSICFQENEVLRLSQAFADKYYYEMKFEQYQNLLAQQQCTISKLLNEKKELQEKLEEARVSQNQSQNIEEISSQLHEYQKRNNSLEQKLQEFQLQKDDLFQQKDISDKQLEEYKRLLQKLNKEQEKLSQQFQEFKLQSVMKESEQQQYIQQLQNQQQESQGQKVSSKMYSEIQKQMNEIKQQNNYLFDQLSQKEQAIEQHFQMQVANIVEKLNQEKQELEDEFKAQLDEKDEAIHQLEMQMNDVTNQAQILYSENLQLQNQLDLLGQNYQEDIQQQANMLSQQVAEYKIVINNLENQLFVMNAEIQRRGRSASKESGSRQFQGYMRGNQQRQSGGEMTFSNITPSSKQFQQQNLKN